MSDVTIRAWKPRVGPAIGFELLGEETIEGGLGGWAVVERVRRRAALEWTGTPATTLTLPLMLEGFNVSPGVHRSVESDCASLESWGLPANGQDEPPILQVSGPLRIGSGTRWVLDNLAWGSELREPGYGRVRQELELRLLLYTAATIVLSPAKKARDRREHTPGNS